MTAQSETGTGSVLAAGDFAGIYERHFTEIHRYIAGRLGRDVADDIAADTFVIALRKRDGFDPGRGTVRAWLYGIATNLPGWLPGQLEDLVRPGREDHRDAGSTACLAGPALDGRHERQLHHAAHQPSSAQGVPPGSPGVFPQRRYPQRGPVQ